MATILEPALELSASPQNSDRSFGMMMGAILVLVGLLPTLHWEWPHWWALGAAAAFGVTAVVRPKVLNPLNVAWIALGGLLHRLVSPLIMGAIFFLCVTPIGWLMRMLGRDVLALKRSRHLSTFFVTREPSLNPTTAMKRQF
jgi:hypothetical protein